MATCIFTKDEHVIYASNGICTVEDVKQMSFIKGEPEKTYYILRPQNDKNSTIYIPQDNQLLISKMRAPISAAEIEKAAKSTEACEWIEDRKQRSLYYRELFTAPHPVELLSALKAILKKHAELTEAGKKACAIDRDTYENALIHIKNEFTFVLGDDAQKADEYIKTALGDFPSTI